MYNSSYSQAKLGVSAKKLHKAKGKSCGYYMKIVFFFSSLIQTLIIVCLVLFLVYGQPDQSASEVRLQELDMSHNDLNARYGYLQEEHRNLTWKFNITTRDMDYLQRNMTMLEKWANGSVDIIIGLESKLMQCEMRLPPPCNCPRMPTTCPCPSNGQSNNLQHENNQLRGLRDILQINFTNTFAMMDFELKSANKDREALRLEAIDLRQSKSAVEMQIELFKKSCTEDVVRFLEGIPEVTKAFRLKIDSLIPELFRFQISCPSQREMLEQIQYNCSTLSRDVENKFRPYLEHVGVKISDLSERLSRCQSNKTHVLRELFECKQNLSSLKEKNYKDLREAKSEQDKIVKQHLNEQKKMRTDKELVDKSLRLKDNEIVRLQEQMNSSNCGHRPASPKPGTGTGTAYKLPGGGSTHSSSYGGSGVTGTGNSGSSGSSSHTLLTGGGTHTLGSGRSALGTAGAGSYGPGSSSNTGLSNPGSSGTGASNTGVTRTGLGSTGGMASSGASGASRYGGTVSSSSSNIGSAGAGYNLGSFGTGSDRTGTGGTGLGSSGGVGSTGGFNTGLHTGTGRSQGGTGFSTSGGVGSTGGVFNMGTNPGSSRSSQGGTGLGSSGGLGSTGTGFNTGSHTGMSRSQGGTGFGSSGGLGSTGTGFNTGSHTGTSRSQGGTGLGSSGGLGSTGTGFNMGSFGTGGTGAGHSGTSFGGGTGGAGFGNTGYTGAGGSRPAGTGQGGMGFGGMGSSRTGQTGTGSGSTGGFGGFGSTGTGASRTGFGSSGYGRTGLGGSMGPYGRSNGKSDLA
ncbi:hypothetical protein ACEWY4_006825 [Coilia grayii]|uniref:Keratin, type I cytoskeletal 9-like n=1 Tax=Coilia grayii TaxID=363190 RepID=A0ABD1KER4_9TELE